MITNNSLSTNFCGNRADSVRQVGRFFDSQVKAGTVKRVSSGYIDTLGKRVSQADTRPHIVGLTAYSGAGKSFFAARVQETAPQNVSVFTGDYFYKDLSAEFAKERDIPKKGKLKGFEGIVYSDYCLEGPHNFDLERAAEKVKSLQSGNPVMLDKYLRDGTGNIERDSVPVQPKSLMIIDGICNVFPPLKNVFNANAFYDTSDAVNRQRYFHRSDSELDKVLFEKANSAGHRYIDPHIPTMDIIFNGEMAVENMQKFARGFVDLLTK